MAGLQDLLEAYKNYRGVQDWKLGQQMNRVPGAEEAMNLWGGWDTGGLAGAIKTYHGSPRPEPFTHFSSEFMGSGEGAQAFGKGHYVAERPGIAKGYAEMRGKMFKNELPSEYQNFDPFVIKQIEHGINKYDTPKKFQKYINDLLGLANQNYEIGKRRLSRIDPNDTEAFEYAKSSLERTERELRELGLVDPNIIGQLERKGPLRSLYEVSLEWPGARESVDPMSREHFYQWDKEFRSQPKNIREALMDIAEQHPEIAEPYAKWLAEHNVPGHTTHSLLTLQPQATIKAMQGAIEPLMYERGIPGVAFLDQPSRTKKVGDRTYNYVAFGDEIPRIISHNKPSVLDMLWPKK